MKYVTVMYRCEYQNTMIEVDFGVNTANEGLFVDTGTGVWSQKLGTMQFCARTPRHLMRQLRNTYEYLAGAKMVRGSAKNW